MALSTIGNSKKVSNRIVLLKGIENNNFVFYTNLNSLKSSEIKINKYVAAVFWWPQIGKQVRIEGKVKKVNAGYFKISFVGEDHIQPPIGRRYQFLKSSE